MQLNLVDVVKAVTSSFVKLTAIIACGYHTTRMVIPVLACRGDIPNFLDCNVETLVGPDLLKSRKEDEVAYILAWKMSA